MEEKYKHTIEISVNGNPIGHTNRVFTGTCNLEDTPPDWFRRMMSDGESKRKEMESKWEQLPESTKAAAHQAAYFLGTILHHLGASGLSMDAMVEGHKHTLSIELTKK